MDLAVARKSSSFDGHFRARGPKALAFPHVAGFGRLWPPVCELYAVRL